MATDVERRPGRPRSEQAEAAILDATLELLTEQGFLALTVEAVAARAGVAKTTVYRRWPGKDELVLGAMNCVKGMHQQPPGESVRGDLLFMLQRMRDLWIDDRFGRLMGRLAADGLERPDLYREFKQRFVAPRRAVLRKIIERGVQEGLIRSDVEVERVITLLTAPVIAAALTHQERVPPEQVDFVVDTVLRGLAP